MRNTTKHLLSSATITALHLSTMVAAEEDAFCVCVGGGGQQIARGVEPEWLR